MLPIGPGNSVAAWLPGAPCQAGRLAYSVKATGIRAPGRGRPGGEVREVAA